MIMMEACSFGHLLNDKTRRLTKGYDDFGQGNLSFAGDVWCILSQGLEALGRCSLEQRDSRHAR